MKFYWNVVKQIFIFFLFIVTFWSLFYAVKDQEFFFKSISPISFNRWILIIYWDWALQVIFHQFFDDFVPNYWKKLLSLDVQGDLSLLNATFSKIQFYFAITWAKNQKKFPLNKHFSNPLSDVTIAKHILYTNQSNFTLERKFIRSQSNDTFEISLRFVCCRTKANR